ncbi:IPT/TIG domain-containing protein, partial [Hoeflea sp.]|uniref:IPT/TIG domain-containing protein n=1 Tax=Hoeflea sp. TaxID=1940281 RepID=UPI003A8EB58D
MMIPLSLMLIFIFVSIRKYFDLKINIPRGFLVLLAVAFVFNAGYGTRAANAAWDDCSGLTVTTGNDLTLDLTADTCSLTNPFPGTNDYINFNAGAGASVTIDLIGIDDPSGSFSGVSIVHDGGTTNVPNGTGFGQANDFTGVFSCSTGCTVSGNYDAAPISGSFSVSYTQNAGSGSAAPPAPTVSSVSPATGPAAGGTSVTITGSNLSGATAVAFGATAAASFTVDSATQITATSPAGSGTVDVRVTTAGGVSATSAADEFT